MKRTLSVITYVLKKPTYAFLTLSTALLMIIVTTYLLNLPLIENTLQSDWALAAKASLFIKLLGGVITNNTFPTLLLLVLISTLAGMNLALAIYRRKTPRGFSVTKNSASATGVGIGVLAAGCSSCGLSILAMIGLAGVIVFLPFKGLELSFLSIILLSVTLFWLAKNQTCSAMPIKKKVNA